MNFIENKKMILFILYFTTIVGLMYYRINIFNGKVVSVSATVGKKYIVVVDAGHGGRDPGMVSGDLYEKDINLAIAKYLEKNLLDNGYEVVMTRTADDDLPAKKQDAMYKRKLIANESNGDIFVSIHQNSSSSGNAKGAQVYYFGKSEESMKLAKTVFNQIKSIANPSSKFDPMENDSYYVLKQTTMPAILVECGFMSNSGERWKLTTEDYQKLMAQSIYEGIDDYFYD